MPYISLYMLPEYVDDINMSAKGACFQGKDDESTYDFRAIDEAIHDFYERIKSKGMTGREQFIYLCKQMGKKPTTIDDYEFYGIERPKRRRK